MTLADRMAQMQADECRECGFEALGFGGQCSRCNRRHAATESRRAEVRAWMDRPAPMATCVCTHAAGAHWVRPEYAECGTCPCAKYVPQVPVFEPATCRIVRVVGGWVAQDTTLRDNGSVNAVMAPGTTNDGET